MSKPNMRAFTRLNKHFIQKYERYLPTAFDESSSLLEKVNKVIECLNTIVRHINDQSEALETWQTDLLNDLDTTLDDYVDELNTLKQTYETFRQQILDDILPDSTSNILSEWLDNGTIEQVINRDIFNDIHAQLTQTAVEIDSLNTEKMDKNTTDISVSQINKNKGKLDGTYFSKTFLTDLNNGAINTTNVLPGSIGRNELIDGSVEPRKISFMERTKNMFNGYDEIMVYQFETGYFYSSDAGSYHPRSAVIPLEAGETYTVSVHGDKTSFRILILNSAPVLDGENNAPDEVVLDTNTVDTHTFTNTNSGQYLIVYVGSNGLEPKMQVEKGSESTTYVEPYYVPIEMLDSEVTDAKDTVDTLENKVDRITNLNEFNAIVEKNGVGERVADYLGWEVGTLHSTTVEPLALTNRARTIDFYMPGIYDTEIIAYPGYQFLIYKFEFDGTYVGRESSVLATSYKVEKGYKYKFVVGATDDSDFTEAPLNAIYIKGEKDIGKFVDYDSLITGEYYHIDYPNITVDSNNWNIVKFTVNTFQKYEYSGITNSGGTPSVVFLNDGTVVEIKRLETGTNSFSVPSGIDQFGISVHNNDLDSVKLLRLPEIEPSLISEALNTNRYIPSKLIYELPHPQSAPFVFVRPSQSELDNKYSGLSYSDGIVWRWMEDNKPAISTDKYATVKASDSTLIAGNDVDVIDWSASVTKTLSSLTAVENISDLSETITMIEEDVVISVIANRMAPGDTPTFEQLIHSAIIQSDNNASNALARTVGYKLNPNAESIEDAKQSFYDAMEQTALAIGMNNTDRFGPAYDGLRTTPLDLCKLGIHIHNNVPEISSVWGILEYVTDVTGANPRTLTISSTTSSSARAIIPEFIGGKTGTSGFGAYLFMWEHKDTGEVYATSFLNSNIYNNERFINSRRIIDEVYSIEYNGE